MGFRDFVSDNGVAFPLAVMRLLLAFMFLWNIFDKLFGLGLPVEHGSGIIDGGTPIADFLRYNDGPFAALFNPMADFALWPFLFLLGSLCVGIGLALGICTKLTTIAAIVMLFVLYLADFPTDNPFVSYKLFYIAGLAAIYAGRGYECLGLAERWREIPIVRRFPILE